MNDLPWPEDASEEDRDALENQYRGVDPELIPYLIAAAEDEDEADDSSGADSGADQDDPEAQRLQALRNLVETSLLAGPDPALIAELAGEVAAAELAEEELDEDLDQHSGQVPEETEAQVRELAEQLFARAPEHDFAPSLERMEALADMLGDPQNAYVSIHVAGTNGKTSTSRIADSILGAFGLRVGRFTSPHLSDVRERITIEGEPISRERFLASWEDIAPYVGLVDEASVSEGGPRLSFFETLTAMAFAAWADYPVDVAVVETGMGGTWDATNVIDSGVAVLTTVSKDHQQWLGETLEEIATEKAGIIKDRNIVISEKQEPAVLEIIENRCRATDSVLWLEGRDWEILSRTAQPNGQTLSIRTPVGVYVDLFLPLYGEFQARNAGAALVAVEALLGGDPMRSDLVEAGFQAARSPGRLEVVRTSPMVVIDSAHNPAGARALSEAVEEVFDFDFCAGVYSAMQDKRVEEVLVEMETVLDELVVTQMPGPRAMNLEELTQIAADVFGEDRVHAHADLAEAIDRAAELVDRANALQEHKGVLVFGSVVLAGAATDLLG